MKKYEFTDETKIIDGAVLRRIRAVRDIPERGVRVGTLGGFLQAERNLPHHGPAWVGGGRLRYGLRPGGGPRICE